MRKGNFMVLAILCVFSVFVNSGSKSPDILYWSEDYKLQWNDFEGEPRYDHEAVSAITSSGIVHYKGCKDGKIIYKIQSYFERSESWVKDEALTSHHLAHEQIHFDITELYARKLRKALSEQEFVCGQETEFEDFVTKFLSNWQMAQTNYDFSTRHSVDKEKQKDWFYKIEMELSLLDDFKE